MTLRVFSYGGGVQSTAALVLAARGEIEFPTFLFANVGDDSEHPATLAFVREIAAPFAAEHGVELVEVQRTIYGKPATLLDQITTPRVNRDLIPVRLGETGAPGRRGCTWEFKIRPLVKWLREHGATPDDPAQTGIGISVDEIQRAKPGVDPLAKQQVRTYPLLDLGLDRADCAALIAAAGLQVPPKSACWFCPYTRPRDWQRRRHEEPELFWRAVELERLLQKKRVERGQLPVHLCKHGVNLDDMTTADEQLALFDNTGSDCESGFCMT